MISKRTYILAFVLTILGGSLYLYHHYPQAQTHICKAHTIESFYGPISIQEPVILALIDHPAIQRLKKIHQYGIAHYFSDRYYGEYSRYDHSVGVFALLRKFGAPLEEQIAGLLHDASHTIFSHVGDHIFAHHNHDSSYQDDIHKWYLEVSGLGKTLSEYGFSVDQVLHKKGTFYALEQDLPDICADRLEYNIQGGVLEGLIEKSDVAEILEAVQFNDNKWVFTNATCAKKLARVSLYLTKHQWGSPQNQITYNWAAQAINLMVKAGELTFDDIHFGTDDEIWHRMRTSKNEIVRALVHQITYYKRHYYLSNKNHYDFKSVAKFRGINPLVKTQYGLKRLTEIDANFKDEYETIRTVMDNGWYITFHEDATTVA